MNKVEHYFYDGTVYGEKCKLYTDYCRCRKLLAEALIEVFKIRETLNWLNTFLIKLGF